MNAKLLLSVMLLLGASACSAVLSFDRDKISGTDAGGSVPDEAAVPVQVQQEASVEQEHDMDGAVADTGPELGCQPGTAGGGCEPCKAGEYCAGGNAPALPCPDEQWDQHDHPRH